MRRPMESRGDGRRYVHGGSIGTGGGQDDRPGFPIRSREGGLSPAIDDSRFVRPRTRPCGEIGVSSEWPPPARHAPICTAFPEPAAFHLPVIDPTSRNRHFKADVVVFACVFTSWSTGCPMPRFDSASSSADAASREGKRDLAVSLPAEQVEWLHSLADRQDLPLDRVVQNLLQVCRTAALSARSPSAGSSRTAPSSSSPASDGPDARTSTDS